MWRHLLTKLASYKVPLVMVSTHGSVVPLAMFSSNVLISEKKVLPLSVLTVGLLYAGISAVCYVS